MWFSAKEKCVMDEIQTLKKQLKNKKMEQSFHESRPRKVVLKQREKMKEINDAKQKPNDSAKAKVGF